MISNIPAASGRTPVQTKSPQVLRKRARNSAPQDASGAPPPVHQIHAETRQPEPLPAAPGGARPGESARNPGGLRHFLARFFTALAAAIASLWRPRARPLTVRDGAALRAELAVALDEGQEASVRGHARDPNSQAPLPVSPIFANDLHRSTVTIGAQHFSRTSAGAQQGPTPGAPSELRVAADALLDLCGQDVAWAHRVSGLLSQNVGNTLCVVVHKGERVAWQGQAVQAWVQALNAAAEGLVVSAQRDADGAVEVVVSQAVPAAKLMLAGQGTAPRMVNVAGTLSTQVRIVVPKDAHAPLVVTNVALEGALRRSR